MGQSACLERKSYEPSDEVLLLDCRWCLTVADWL